MVFYNKMQKLLFNLLVCVILTSILLLLPGTVIAQPGPGQNIPPNCDANYEPQGTKCVLKNPSSGYLVTFPDFDTLLERVISWLLYFAGGIAVLFLLVGGFQYISARGNEEATEKAKKTITGAIIGIVIIVMAFAIIAIISNLVTTAPPTN